MNSAGINETSQYLTFKLDHETYALDITKVREVLEFSEITKVPRMPEFMSGVINLRGGVVPVVDLRIKFGMTRTEKTIDACIIIIDLVIEDEITLLGALTDSVEEVMTMGTEQILQPPKIGTRLNTEFIKGMGKKNDEFVIILDIDRVFSSEDLTTIMGPEELNIQEQGSF
jgi:purine-binding chemotaxis protein CheW